MTPYIVWDGSLIKKLNPNRLVLSKNAFFGTKLSFHCKNCESSSSKQEERGQLRKWGKEGF
jgi:hypothetical protein